AYVLGIDGNGNYMVSYVYAVGNIHVIRSSSSANLNTGTAVNRIALTVRGSTLEVRLNGVLEWSGTDTNISGAGRAGLAMETTSGPPTTVAYFDNIAITPDTLEYEQEVVLSLFGQSAVGPTADFIAVPTEGEAPLTVDFEQLCEPGDAPIVSWYWDFGDTHSSDDSSPTHIYDNPATYTVSLTIIDENGIEVEATKEGYITVGYPVPAMGALGLIVLLVCCGLGACLAVRRTQKG
ncbi:MAG: PKD domain-containing protein, partial [Candidatus Hydrogenedentes bacterium]|nr:PKD domain-containing protein [Candidatus Hydrogenedentota bacterium]